jgi:HEAT repeat protein
MSIAENHWWLQQQLKFNKPEVRRQAIERLAREDPAGALPLLLAVTDDEDREVRLAALKALAQGKDDRVLRPLLNALRDAEAVIREVAVNAIESFGDPACVKALVPLLKDRNLAVRRRAARALDNFGWRPHSDSERVQRAVALGEYSRAASVGVAALDALLSVLDDLESPERRLAIEALGTIKDERIVAPLVAALNDRDPQVRGAALEALGHVQTPEASEALMRLLQDGDPAVRATAAKALGRLGDAASFDRLTMALNDPHWSVRKFAIEALAQIQEPRAAPFLAEVLRDPDAEVRQAAIEALAKLPDAAPLELLILALADPHSAVRDAAAEALAEIDPDWKCSEAARAAMPAMEALQHDRDYWVRSTATEILHRITIAKKPVPKPTEPPRAQASLITALKDWDRDMRLAAAEALGRLRDTGTAQALHFASKDSDEWVRQAAWRALQGLTE